MALDSAHDLVPALISVARSEGLLFCHESPSSFIQPQQFPAEWLVADAATGNLPDAHHGVVFVGDAHGVNLNVAGIPVIPKMKNVP